MHTEDIKSIAENNDMIYKICDTVDETFVNLTCCLDAELVERYGSRQAQYNPLNRVEAADAILAMDGGIAAGCGCFKRYDAETAEIKRMYVKPAYRGRGIAGELLVQLEARAAEQGYKAVVLETGVKQQEAIGLYGKCGYIRIPNYGPYADMENSVCFKKRLISTDLKNGHV